MEAMRSRAQGLCLSCPCCVQGPRGDVLPLMQASQNLVVLAREDAGAEKIFRSNGVQLLQRLLDTGESDLMLAALRTLVGICSEHQSRVRVPEGLVITSIRPSICLSIHPSIHSPTLPPFYSSSYSLPKCKVEYKETCNKRGKIKMARERPT